jgi:chromate transporter
VVLTVSAVGYAAHGMTGAALATVVAFTPSFVFVIVGARHFERLRRNSTVGAFLAGAGPSVIGAIAASSTALAMLMSQAWQGAVLAVALLWLVGLRRSPTLMLLGAGVLGAVLSGVVPV